ncbi:prolipoprotein diacylglyceryl transferase [Arenimonas sp.]|nr:prolipoprotein diacylglyceryl transferase [Candidatus Parcubacteria bacterium]
MHFPYDIHIGTVILHIHLVTDILSIYIGYRYYKYLRNKKGDHLPGDKRYAVIIGAAAGALIGSRLLAFFEHINTMSDFSLLYIFSNKTIAGGVIGGIIGVEIVKKITKIKTSTGDLLVLPLILGIGIGRIGCFLTGVKDGTVGNVSTMPWTFDQGDGLMRHPTSLYEIVFLIICFFMLQKLLQKKLQEGLVFKLFASLYLLFRLCIEFIKPREIVFLNLSYIQIASALFVLYYLYSFLKIYKNRHQVFKVI